MKSDNMLKKHHFWVLLGVVPLLTLIAMFVMSSSVSERIAARESIVKKANDTIAPKMNPKTAGSIREAEKLADIVGRKQGDLHKVNWERQKHLYTWPTASPLLKDYEQQNLKFGDPLRTDRGEFDEFRRPQVYLHLYSSLNPDGSGGPGTGMADRIAPTRFNGGWQSVLRHVTDFGGSKINSSQVWLIMEDIWVQRSLLDAVRSINEEMAAFRRAKYDTDKNIVIDESYDEKGNKLATDRNGKPVVDKNGNFTYIPIPDEEKKKGLFRNRTWAVELEIIQTGSEQQLTGKLINLTNRLQLMGAGNMMSLNVWFTHDPSEQPMVFRFGGEYLPGIGTMHEVDEPVLGPDKKPMKDRDGKEITERKTVPANELKIIPTDDHYLPPGRNIEEIVRVEQLFDIRTVPIKRIDALALGKPDNRNGDTMLKAPLFIEDAPPPPPPKDDGFPKGPGPIPPKGGPEPKGVPGQPAAKGGSTGGGGGSLDSVINSGRFRYLEVTEQIRRMPVAIVVVVDQSLIQDVLMAFANSPLRFQITQVAWTRFHEELGGGPASGSPNDPSGGIDVRGGGSVNLGGEIGPGPGPVRPPMGKGPSAGAPGVPGKPPSGVSDAQLTAGLVKLSIYGIVSLYEKYPDPKQDEAAAGPGGPTTPAPAPAPAPATPPSVPKQRRRYGVRSKK